MAVTTNLSLEKANDLNNTDLGTLLLNLIDANSEKIDSEVGDLRTTISEYTNLAAFPATGVVKTFYIDLATGLVYRWNTTLTDYTLIGGSGGSAVTVSYTAPSDPDENDLWWNSTAGVNRMFIYYNDGDSSQWVEASPIGITTFKKTATLAVATWAGSAAPYSYTVTDATITATDLLLIDLDVSSETYANQVLKEAQYTNIYRIESAAGSYVIYAHAVPNLELDVTVMVVK